jgi:endothelin-converting enzyme
MKKKSFIFNNNFHSKKNTTKNKISNNIKKSNKTKKKMFSCLSYLSNLPEKQKKIICNIYSNNYNSFEDKLEEVFKKNKINISSTSYNLEKQIVKELKKAISPSNITPNNDFYTYINERWLKDLDLEAYQKYIIQVDEFRLTQDKVYRELINIIEEFLNNKSNNSSSNKKFNSIKNAYNSFKIFNTNLQTKEYCKEILNNIDKYIETNNCWGLLSYVNSNEIISWGAPFVWTINPDEKNPKIYKCYLEGPQVTLLDYEIYFDDKNDDEITLKYKKKYRSEFNKYLEELFTLAFGENHAFNVKDIFDCEYDLINAMACNIIKVNDEDNYNLISKTEALNNFNFDWNEFCKELGFKEIPNEFITSNVNYLLCGTKLFKENWNKPKWRTYFIYIFIRQICRLNKQGSINYHYFEGKLLRGQEQDIDDYIRPIFFMGFLFNSFLTNEYILRYKNQYAINYVNALSKDLLIVFKRIITRNKWLNINTKKIAIEKLDALKFIIGSPPKLIQDPYLDYSPNDIWGNLLKFSNWRHNKAINLVNKSIIDIPSIDWSETPPKFIGTQAFVVNAMYTPTENSIYIPLGYIQKPFIDLDERGLEYNLAHIGFTIAHELSHALDDWGSNYNKDGKLENWWTNKDKKYFKKIQKDIVKQYETFASYDGIDFDAWPSIGEDLADISGFAICQEYLRDFQLKNEDILPIQSISFEAFFIYFALQSRQKISKKAILAQLKTNPHPLDKYRCNVPLSRTRIFNAMYNVKKGDNMWWHSFNNVWSD